MFIDTINIYTWSKYIPSDIIQEFEQQYNIKVIYNIFDTAQIATEKIRYSNKSQYDLILTESSEARKLIEYGRACKINTSKCKGKFDIRENDYSIIYMYGTTGILYNKKLMKEYFPDWDYSLNIFFDNNIDIKKRVSLLQYKYDALSCCIQYMYYHGYTDSRKSTFNNLKKAVKFLHQNRIKKKLGNLVDGLSMNSNMIAIQCMSSYASIQMKSNPDLAYVIPKEGGEIWFDVFCILNEKDSVYKFINFINTRKQDILTRFNFINTSTDNTIENNINLTSSEKQVIDILWMQFLVYHEIWWTKFILVVLILSYIYYFVYRK